MIVEKAFAKINLFLDVTERTDDGFHNINSVMHSVSLSDVLTLQGELSDRVEIILSTDAEELPVDSTNLVYRSALRYLAKFGIMAKIKIHLEKKIPIGAGLAGGSSDAAATLRAMNAVFGCADQAELYELACGLGSDVPFCLLGGTALCRGRGERITSLSADPELDLVIAIGNSRISTPAAYAALDERYAGFSGQVYRPKDSLCSRLVSDIETGQDFSSTLYNIFETVTQIPEIDEIKKTMIKSGAEATLMSGSGPSVFGIFADSASAETACCSLKEQGFTAYTAVSVKRKDKL